MHKQVFHTCPYDNFLFFYQFNVQIQTEKQLQNTCLPKHQQCAVFEA